jgi:hypothetical protein
MFLTYREMQRQVQAKIQNFSENTGFDNDLLLKIKDWINDRYVRIYRSFPWRESIDVLNYPILQDTEEYVLHRDVGDIISIYDTTNDRPIKMETIENFQRRMETLKDIPSKIRLTGTYSVKAAIGNTAERIKIVSSDVRDISPNIVRIEGYLGGVEIGEDITLTGTTQSLSVNTYDKNQKLKVSVGTLDGTRKRVYGKITVSGNTSSTVFSEIAPSEYAHKYIWFRVAPVPSKDATWEMWYQKSFKRLDKDTDIPILDCCIELVQGAFADALLEDGLEQEGQLAEGKFVTMVKELQSTRKNNTIIEQFKPNGGESISRITNPYEWVV